MTPLQSLIASGTKLWLDSIDPDLVKQNRAMGATGATSNPIIVGNLIKTGRFDEAMVGFIREGMSDEDLAWRLTDMLVREAQQVFLPVWQETKGNNGYVSFELDPLLEDPGRNIPESERTKQYLSLAKKWNAGHQNRMIKVPATPGGIAALEDVVAAGVTVNVTLIFSDRQYEAARDAVWRGAKRRASLDKFKSVYSIFVSRLDVYTAEHVPQLSSQAQGMVGIVNAKRIWRENKSFWADKGTPLQQEMIFASTGRKVKTDTEWKYVEAFAGSDIETNPPETNAAVEASGHIITSHINELPPTDVLDEIDRLVDMQKLEEVLMAEGVKKFADPQKKLIEQIAKKRRELTTEKPK